MAVLRCAPLLKGSLAGVAGAGVGAAVQVAVVLVVVRAFPAEVAGAFCTLMALSLMCAGVLRMDAGNALVRALARAVPAPGPDTRAAAAVVRDARVTVAGTRTARPLSAAERGASGCIRAAVAPVFGLSCVAAVGLLLCAEPLSGALGMPPGWVRTAAAALPMISCSEVLVAATRGFGTVRPTLYLSGLLQPITQLALVSGTAWLHAPALLPLAWTLPYAVVAPAAALWLWRHTRPAGPDLPRLGAYRRVWAHNGPRAVAGGVQAVFQRLDIVLVATLAGPAEAACYTAATRFKVVGQLAAQGLAHAAQPRLVRALTGGDLRHAARLYQTTTLWLVAATWPLWIGYAALAPRLPAVLGADYRQGAHVAVVVAAAMMAASACGLADVVLTSAGHAAASLASTVAAVAVTVVLDLALIPSCGALGAALGWAGGVLVKNLMPLLRIHRAYGLRPFGVHTRTALSSWRLG